MLEEGRSIADRALWIVLIGLGAAFAIYGSMRIYRDFQSNPVITSVSTTGFDIREIEYPAITICSQGDVDEVLGKLLTTDQSWAIISVIKGTVLDQTW